MKIPRGTIAGAIELRTLIGLMTNEGEQGVDESLGIYDSKPAPMRRVSQTFSHVPPPENARRI